MFLTPGPMPWLLAEGLRAQGLVVVNEDMAGTSTATAASSPATAPWPPTPSVVSAARTTELQDRCRRARGRARPRAEIDRRGSDLVTSSPGLRGDGRRPATPAETRFLYVGRDEFGRRARDHQPETGCSRTAGSSIGVPITDGRAPRTGLVESPTSLPSSMCRAERRGRANTPTAPARYRASPSTTFASGHRPATL